MNRSLVMIVLAAFGVIGCERAAAPASREEKAETPESPKPEFTREEPKVEDLIGVWQPDKETLADLQSRSGGPKMVELILRRNGTCLLQGVPAKWIDESKRDMPLYIGSAGGKWMLRKNWDGWEIRLEAPERASLVVTLTGERPSYSIVVPCADSRGSFHVVFYRGLPKE